VPLGIFLNLKGLVRLDLKKVYQCLNTLFKAVATAAHFLVVASRHNVCKVSIGACGA
jgi:hypothetical protein